MKRVLDKNNTLYFSKYYPHISKNKSTKPYQAVLGIGGNVGNVRRRFNHLFWVFKSSSFIDIVETSPILRNPPFGYLEQPMFYNSLLIVKTCLKPKAFLRYILNIEKRFGRKRSFQDAPRTLDIDMIFYENISMQTTVLTLPHPAWSKRDSVLIPMSYIQTNLKKLYNKRDHE